MGQDLDRYKKVRIATVIVNYRTPGLVIDCLETLVPEIDPGSDLVVVVDNGSGDGSVNRIESEIAARRWERVRVIASHENRGYSAGNNLGIRSTAARAYFLLNSDTLVKAGAVLRLWKVLQSDARIGLVGPRQESRKGTPLTSCFRFHTPWSELIAGAGTGPIRTLLSRWDVPLPTSKVRCEPEWTSFAGVLIRREVIDNVGLLDEGFFMYFEDVDYCRRARKAGWRIVHEPSARIVHFHGASSAVVESQRNQGRLPRYYYAARSRYFRKSMGRSGLFAANLMRTFGRAIAWLRERVGRKRPHAAEAELLDLWRG